MESLNIKVMLKMVQKKDSAAQEEVKEKAKNLDF